MYVPYAYAPPGLAGSFIPAPAAERRQMVAHGISRGTTAPAAKRRQTVAHGASLGTAAPAAERRQMVAHGASRGTIAQNATSPGRGDRKTKSTAPFIPTNTSRRT